MLVTGKDFRISPRALMFDPEFFVFDFTPESGLSRFLVVEEKNLVLAPFTDIRFEPLAQGHFSVATGELVKLEHMHGIQRPRSVFIFHHAFVCSTLLARCLNQIDTFFSLKEPWILRRLAELKRVHGNKLPARQWQDIFTCHLGLLAKNYHTGKVPVIKVTNIANNLVEDVLQHLPGHKILYLYSDLESFLVSNLKKAPETQKKMPALAAAFLADGNFARRFPQFSNVKRLPFLQVCALIWLLSLYNFQGSTKAADPASMRMLEMNDFLIDMGSALQRLSHFFGHGAAPMEIKRMLAPSVTQTNAKHQNVPYGTQSKQRETEQVLAKHHAEIKKAMAWIMPMVDKLGVLEYANKNQLENP